MTGCIPLPTNKQEPIIEEEALVYLEEKYNKEFVINNSKKNSDSGLYTFNVSTKSELDRKFTVSVYEKEKDFNDNYLKRLLAEEIQKRDISKLEELFPSKFHSFYGNLVFKDEILSDLNNVRVSDILNQDAEVLHDYVIYFDSSFTIESDKEKLALLILYLKDVGVKRADIDFVFFKNSPAKAAYESHSYYLKNEGVDLVLSIQPDQYEEINTKKKIREYIDNLLEG